MQRHRKLAFGSLLVFAAGIAYAADQTILGSSFLVKNTGSAAQRKVVGKGKETTSPNTIVGNPTLLGGSLTISASGANPSTQSFFLPAIISGVTGKPLWSGDAVKGFKYKDSKGEIGPVSKVQIKKTPSGVFKIAAVVNGKHGTINVVPPNPGNFGCMQLAINGGDSYSVQFGATSTFAPNNASVFKAKKPLVQGTCNATTTTTTAPTTTTTAPPYGSASRAFVDRVAGLLD